MDGRAGTTVVSGEAGGPIVVVVVWLVVVWCALVVRRLRIDVMLACVGLPRPDPAPLGRRLGD